jgi:hypothetical protein
MIHKGFIYKVPKFMKAKKDFMEPTEKIARAEEKHIILLVIQYNQTMLVRYDA